MTSVAFAKEQYLGSFLGVEIKPLTTCVSSRLKFSTDWQMQV